LAGRGCLHTTTATTRNAANIKSTARGPFEHFAFHLRDMRCTHLSAAVRSLVHPLAATFKKGDSIAKSKRHTGRGNRLLNAAPPPPLLAACFGVGVASLELARDDAVDRGVSALGDCSAASASACQRRFDHPSNISKTWNVSLLEEWRFCCSNVKDSVSHGELCGAAGGPAPCSMVHRVKALANKIARSWLLHCTRGAALATCRQRP
jgi:hypothetical protein